MSGAAGCFTASCFTAKMGDAFVEAAFGVLVETRWGDQVWAVGAAEELGSWSPEHALELHTCDATYPRWSGKVTLPRSAVEGVLEYKFVVTHSDGSVEWEPGSNRALVRVGGKPSTRSPPYFGEADPAAPASEAGTEEPQESEISTTAEDDSCSASAPRRMSETSTAAEDDAGGSSAPAASSLTDGTPSPPWTSASCLRGSAAALESPRSLSQQHSGGEEGKAASSGWDRRGARQAPRRKSAGCFAAFGR